MFQSTSPNPPRRRWRYLGLFAAWLAACAEVPFSAGPADTDAGLPDLDAFARDGTPQPLAALPHRPVLRLTGVGAVSEPGQAVWLLPGPPTPELLADLEGKPLTQHYRRTALPLEVAAAAGGLWLTPGEPLRASAPYTLAVAAWLAPGGSARAPGASARLPLPLAIELRAAGPAGGARLLASLPAAGQAGVSPDLERVLFAWIGAPRGCAGTRLLDAQGNEQPATVRALPCSRVDDRADLCCAIELTRALAPANRYLADFSDLSDSHGAPVDAGAVDFATAAAHPGGPVESGPALLPFTCAVDETASRPGVCALPSDDRVSLRVRVGEPALLQLSGAGDQLVRLVPGSEVELPWTGLAPSAAYALSLQLTAADGRAHAVEVEVATTQPLATLAIAEVRADPRGKEPDQEFVELWNHGATPVDVSGFTLSDALDSAGSLIPHGPPVQPGERILLVADGFDPNAPEDAPTPPGVRLVRLGRALASAGLSNAGEALYLRDADGHRVSASPASPRPRPGACLVRAVSTPPNGALPDFHMRTPCTPGRAPEREPQ